MPDDNPNTPTTGNEKMGELLPCPFCGATDERLVQAFTRAGDGFFYWSVECLDCGCEVASDASQDEADKYWNTRTQPTAEAVREACAKVAEAGRWGLKTTPGWISYDQACDDIASAIRSMPLTEVES